MITLLGESGPRGLTLLGPGRTAVTPYGFQDDLQTLERSKKSPRMSTATTRSSRPP
jgi:hypothetical protein